MIMLIALSSLLLVETNLIDQISVSCDHLSTVAANHIYLNSLDGNLISM